MTCRLSVIVPTAGRPTLPRALASAAAQLAPGDELLVLRDASGDWGGTPRNAAMPRAAGDYLVFLDDDDALAPGGLGAVRRAAAAAPGRPLLFRIETAPGRYVWADRGAVRVGNAGTGGIVVPNAPARLGRWSARYECDFDFLASTLALHPPGALVWRDEVLTVRRPGGAVYCRACHSPDLAPLPFAAPGAAGRWSRCAACGSDTAAHGYDPGLYTADYYRAHAGTADPAALRESVRSNCAWFGHHAAGLPNRDFLDVGCADGAALAVMQESGWAVHGFDVARPPCAGAHVTVGAHFSRWLFPLRYGAVLCREVVEHVESPDLLLHELHGVACPGGLVQVQTPRPGGAFHPDVYQRAHLCVLSPARLRALLHGAMLDVIDARVWETGQAYLCRARR